MAYPSSSRSTSSERVRAAVHFFRCPGVRGVVLESLECCALAQTKLSAAAMCRHVSSQPMCRISQLI